MSTSQNANNGSTGATVKKLLLAGLLIGAGSAIGGPLGGLLTKSLAAAYLGNGSGGPDIS